MKKQIIKVPTGFLLYDGKTWFFLNTFGEFKEVNGFYANVAKSSRCENCGFSLLIDAILTEAVFRKQMSVELATFICNTWEEVEG